MPTMNDVVQAYITLRDQKKAIEERHKKELEPIRKAMYKLELSMLSTMHKQRAQSVKTDAGTVYISTLTRASVEDWPTILEFIQEKELWPMLERRVSLRAVEEYIEAQGESPPGVKVRQEEFARVRR